MASSSLKQLTIAVGLGLANSSCCVVQLILNSMSIGCAGFAVLTPWRFPLLTLSSTFSLMAIQQNGGLINRRSLVSVLALSALSLSPEIVKCINTNCWSRMWTSAIGVTTQILDAPAAADVKSNEIGQVITLHIRKIKCEACANNAKNALGAVPGVLECSVFFSGMGQHSVGRVCVRKGAIVTDDQLKEAIEKIHFEAEIVERRQSD